MLPNQLCVLLKDKATTDLELSCVMSTSVSSAALYLITRIIATLPQRYVYKCNLVKIYFSYCYYATIVW